jgi:hypothetical protein
MPLPLNLSVHSRRLVTAILPRAQLWLALGAAALVVATGVGVSAAEAGADDFGKDIQLAPFVVKGSALSVAVHARNKSDRRYGEKFAEDVVEVAYETETSSIGRGLVIVGSEGEPHPIHVIRKFMELAKAGQLDPSLATSREDLDAMMKTVRGKMKLDENPELPHGMDFETIIRAIPLPLEGVASPLYQIAWAEGFDEARVEQRLKALTKADLSSDKLKAYNWVFYLPPQSATSQAFKEALNKTMKGEKMGLFKRAAIRTAVFTFSPAIKKAFEAMRKAMLYMTILRSEKGYHPGDVDALVRAYVREIMPDLKPGSNNERGRVIAAIEKAKIANAEYAKDPFVKPERLATFDREAYARFAGEFTNKPPETTHRFKLEGDSFHWIHRNGKPRVFFPAGERLFVSEDGSMTIQFLLDETGAVTGAEERWVRRRQTIPRKPTTAVPQAVTPAEASR